MGRLSTRAAAWLIHTLLGSQEGATRSGQSLPYFDREEVVSGAQAIAVLPGPDAVIEACVSVPAYPISGDVVTFQPPLPVSLGPVAMAIGTWCAPLFAFDEYTSVACVRSCSPVENFTIVSRVVLPSGFVMVVCGFSAVTVIS